MTTDVVGAGWFAEAHDRVDLAVPVAVGGGAFFAVPAGSAGLDITLDIGGDVRELGARLVELDVPISFGVGTAPPVAGGNADLPVYVALEADGHEALNRTVDLAVPVALTTTGGGVTAPQTAGLAIPFTMSADGQGFPIIETCVNRTDAPVPKGTAGVYVELVGGGGAGGCGFLSGASGRGGGGGGGGGSVHQRQFIGKATLGPTYTTIWGQGGTGSSSGGTDGGESRFASGTANLRAMGGKAGGDGTASAAGAAGAGGVPSGGTVGDRINGTAGGVGGLNSASGGANGVNNVNGAAPGGGGGSGIGLLADTAAPGNGGNSSFALGGTTPLRGPGVAGANAGAGQPGGGGSGAGCTTFNEGQPGGGGGQAGGGGGGSSATGNASGLITQRFPGGNGAAGYTILEWTAVPQTLIQGGVANLPVASLAFSAQGVMAEIVSADIALDPISIGAGGTEQVAAIVGLPLTLGFEAASGGVVVEATADLALAVDLTADGVEQFTATADLATPIVIDAAGVEQFTDTAELPLSVGIGAADVGETVTVGLDVPVALDTVAGPGYPASADLAVPIDMTADGEEYSPFPIIEINTPRTNEPVPVGVAGCFVRLVGAGGGGGPGPNSGSAFPSGNGGGSGGGGGAAISRIWIPVTDLGATYTTEWGQGGTSAAAGGRSRFASGAVDWIANGGGAGATPTSAAAVNGGGGGTASRSGGPTATTFNGTAGGNSGAGTAAVPAAPTNVNLGGAGPGGGGGGGSQYGTTHTNGAAGATATDGTNPIGGAGGAVSTTNGPGNNGADGPTLAEPYISPGGGGGGARGFDAISPGGNGGRYGAGGGGGASGFPAGSSGGKGGEGLTVIEWHDTAPPVPIFDAIGAGIDGTSPFNFTAAPGADVFALGFVNGNGSPTGVSHGGTPMTEIPGATIYLNNNASMGCLKWYRLRGAGTGTAQPVAGTVTGSGSAFFNAISATGVGTVPAATTDASGGSALAQSVSATGLQLVIQAFAAGWAASFTNLSGGQNRFNRSGNALAINTSTGGANFGANAGGPAMWCASALVLDSAPPPPVAFDAVHAGPHWQMGFPLPTFTAAPGADVFACAITTGTTAANWWLTYGGNAGTVVPNSLIYSGISPAINLGAVTWWRWPNAGTGSPLMASYNGPPAASWVGCFVSVLNVGSVTAAPGARGGGVNSIAHNVTAAPNELVLQAFGCNATTTTTPFTSYAGGTNRFNSHNPAMTPAMTGSGMIMNTAPGGADFTATLDTNRNWASSALILS